MNGRQGGDPAKLAAALVQLAALEEPPLRFPAGADAVEIFEQTADNCAPLPTRISALHEPRDRRGVLSTELKLNCTVAVVSGASSGIGAATAHTLPETVHHFLGQTGD